jgi:hypothetical protein
MASEPKKYHIGRFGSRYASGKAIHILKDMDLGNNNTILHPICQGMVGRGEARGNIPHAKILLNATIDQITCKRCLKHLKERPQLALELSQ